MIKILVDSGSSIKADELDKYGIELIPLKILLGDKEYLDDGKDLTMDVFYDFLMNSKAFPKTSLPSFVDVEKRVNEITKTDEVIILTISSGISSTYNTFKTMFENNKKVKVIDSMCAVGGMRLIVDLINRNKDKSLDEIEQLVKDFIPHIRIMAIPETLHYLLKGGRLSKTEWLIGSILQIKPTIGFKNGKVKVVNKTRGIKKGMKEIIEALDELEVDENYDIVASYTYDDTNLKELIEMTPDKYKPLIRSYDNLDPAIASHWGPNAFGYIFVSKK